jgi:hypothetical protein
MPMTMHIGRYSAPERHSRTIIIKKNCPNDDLHLPGHNGAFTGRIFFRLE